MSTQIPAAALLDPVNLDNPYPFYQLLQRQAPVWQVPDTQIYLVTRYGLLDEAARRVEDFSSNLTSVLYRKRSGLPGRVTHKSGVLQVLATADPPIHAEHKAAVMNNFSVKRIAELKSEVEKVAIHYVEKAIKKGKTDFMADIANPLPMQIVSDMVGFTESNIDKLLQAAFDSTAIVSGSSSIFQLGWCMLRALLIQRWIAGQLRAASPEKQAILGDIKRSIDNGKLREIEGRAFLHLFLAAGGESTTSLLGSAVRILAENQDLQQTLREQAELIPNFIEEVLRLESPFRFHLRSTPNDTELGGIAIPSGASVLMFWSAGNRDPETFSNPDQIDLFRHKKHMAFGRGIHTCVGAPLARLEAQMVLLVLLERTSSILLEPDEPPKWVGSLQVRRYEKLPLILNPQS